MHKLLFSLFLSICSSVVFGGESPVVVDGAKTVSTEEAHQLFKDGALFLDVRRDSDWEAGRIAGAAHLNLKKSYSEPALSEEVGKEEVIVIYCNGVKCLRSSKASALAVNWGFSNVHYFRDGFPAWKQAGYPVE